jgi:hypothetical protein
MSLRWIWIAVVVVAAAGCEKQAPPAAPPADDAAAAAVVIDAASLTDAPDVAAADAAGAPAVEPSATDAAPAATPPGKPAGKAPADAAAADAPPDTAGSKDGEKPNDKPMAKPPSSNGKGACGGIAGFQCGKGQKCRYGKSLFKPGYPDAMGTCVAETYCDAPKDCEGLIHPMVVGAWACQKTACAWKAEAGAPQ